MDSEKFDEIAATFQNAKVEPARWVEIHGMSVAEVVEAIKSQLTQKGIVFTHEPGKEFIVCENHTFIRVCEHTQGVTAVYYSSLNN